MVEKILTQMKSIIADYQLAILQTYPNDLLVHDRRILEHFECNGATFAWMVGHTHTHIVNLGLHPEENEMVKYLTNLASTDRFFLIKLFTADAALKEISRDGFGQLAATQVPYTKLGTDSNFKVFKNGQLVGKINIERRGAYEHTVYLVQVRAEQTASKLDKLALQIWGEKGAATCAGTLFIKIETSFEVTPQAIAAT